MSAKRKQTLHERAAAYADSRVPLWTAYLRGDKRAMMKLLDDAIPRVNARIKGLTLPRHPLVKRRNPHRR